MARDRARDGVRPPPGLGGQAPAEPHPRGRAADGPRRRPRDHLLALHAPPRRRRVRRSPPRRSPRSPTGSTPATCSRSPTCRGCAPATREPDERLILLVGRLVYEKGFHLALDALPGLIERLGNVRFLIAGSGTAEAELKAQAERLGLMEHGSFVGWTGDDELHSLYRIADLCLVPSIYEPFGLVALEAMASGCPCIVADTGGLREVVPGGGRVGLRFRPKDSKALGRMAEQILTDDALRDRLVAEAREHVLRFDWADVARQTADVYARRSAGSARPRRSRPPPRARSARRPRAPRARRPAPRRRSRSAAGESGCSRTGSSTSAPAGSSVGEHRPLADDGAGADRDLPTARRSRCARRAARRRRSRPSRRPPRSGSPGRAGSRRRAARGRRRPARARRAPRARRGPPRARRARGRAAARAAAARRARSRAAGRPRRRRSGAGWTRVRRWHTALSNGAPLPITWV